MMANNFPVTDKADVEFSLEDEVLHYKELDDVEGVTISCEPVLTPVAKEYEVFHKRFHIPNMWMDNQPFRELVEHRYATANTAEAFTYIRERLEALGYHRDNESMAHDYLHFMILDLLAAEDTPFLSENDLRGMQAVMSLFSNLTPDIIVQSDKHCGRLKPVLLDVYVGKNEEEMRKKKQKYAGWSGIFDFKCITRIGFTSELQSILSRSSIDYLKRHFDIFMVEFVYWRSCLRLQKILLNDVNNIEMKSLRLYDAFVSKVDKFKDALQSKVESLLVNDGL